MKRSLIAGFVTTIALALVPASAMAASENICVPTGPNEPVISTKTSGTSCRTGYTLVTPSKEGPAGPKGETGATGPEGLSELSPYISFTNVHGQPTIRFSGVNVQIVNGMGKTRSINGVGNLLIGYDETEPGCCYPQTGSHNLIFGEYQTFTSYGGIDAGWLNQISAPFASVSGGWGNTASGEYSSVSGGTSSSASGKWASTSGGDGSNAIGQGSSVSGGEANYASGDFSSVLGGARNKASAYHSAISGGTFNEATGANSSILGGHEKIVTEEWGTFPE
jgi:hypothetical protein